MDELISTNDLQELACDEYGFNEPKTDRDWMHCVNFWAWFVDKGLEVEICRIIAGQLNCPLSDEIICTIALFQLGHKPDQGDAWDKI